MSGDAGCEFRCPEVRLVYLCYTLSIGLPDSDTCGNSANTSNNATNRGIGITNALAFAKKMERRMDRAGRQIRLRLRRGCETPRRLDAELDAVVEGAEGASVVGATVGGLQHHRHVLVRRQNPDWRYFLEALPVFVQRPIHRASRCSASDSGVRRSPRRTPDGQGHRLFRSPDALPAPEASAAGAGAGGLPAPPICTTRDCPGCAGSSGQQ